MKKWNRLLNYLKGKLINYGFPEEVVSINLITKEEMTIEAELYFKIAEVGKKFYDKKVNYKNSKIRLKKLRNKI